MFSTRIATGARHIIRPSSRKVKAVAPLPIAQSNAAATITITGWQQVQNYSTMSQSSTAVTAGPAVSPSGKPLYSFVLFAPDYADDGCLSRRLAVRTTHLAGAAQLKQTGLLSTLTSYMSRVVELLMSSCHPVVAESGVSMVSPDTYASNQKNMIGSMLVYQAESIEDVKQLVEQDIYYTSNVVRLEAFL